jgi:apolipoprotein N-acyltransferase
MDPMSPESPLLMTKFSMPAAARQQVPAEARPEPRPPARGSGAFLRLWLTFLAGAGLLWLSYFPVNWGWFGWVALVPFLAIVRTTVRPRLAYLGCWLAGLLFYLAALQWMRVADFRMVFTWLGLTLYCSVFNLVAFFLVRQLDRRTKLPLVVSVPAVWTAVEFARAHLLEGFPWYFLGHTQHAFLAIIQPSDLAGAYAVTFLVAAVNAWVFELLCNSDRFRRLLSLPEDAARSQGRKLVGQAAVVGLLFVGSLGYGLWRLSQDHFEMGPRLALIQGNLDQRIRNDASDPSKSEQAAGHMLTHFWDLSEQAAKDKPDLIVWPETSFPYGWPQVMPDLPADKAPPLWQTFLKRFDTVAQKAAAEWGSAVLLGVNTERLGEGEKIRRYNSALLITRQGRQAECYDKIHRVPFGEYVPFRDWLPFMNALAPYDFDYSLTAGEQFTRFPLGKYHFGVVICYEDTDTYLARQYVRSAAGEPVDFLVNLSNDGWFDGTSEHEEHLAICRFRAVECRRAVARAVNMGISAMIDGNGQVVALPAADWAGSKKIKSVLTAAIPLDRRTSAYAQLGDWLPWTCWALIGVALFGTWMWPGLFRSERGRTM